jgi:hypothetical protein
MGSPDSSATGVPPGTRGFLFYRKLIRQLNLPIHEQKSQKKWDVLTSLRYWLGRSFPIARKIIGIFGTVTSPFSADWWLPFQGAALTGDERALRCIRHGNVKTTMIPGHIPAGDMVHSAFSFERNHMTTYHAKEFAEALYSKNGLPSLPQSPIVLTGLVRPADVGPAAIEFSPETTCLVWITIPMSIIEKVEYLGKVPCRDHQHDHVHLHLKFSIDASPEATAYANLLRFKIAELEKARSVMPVPAATASAGGVSPFLSLCSIGCGAAFPGIYPQLVGALAAAKRLGLLTNKKQCEDTVGDAAALTRLIVSAVPELGPVAGILAGTVAKICGGCACGEVF